jgi:prepilin-type N-terminal cleavage/methylation domain-containing protein
MTAERREHGFTVVEVLIAIAVLVLGLAGVMVIQTAVVKGSRDSRRLDRAKLIAQETMETQRTVDLSALPVPSAQVLPPYTTPEGVTYTRQFTIAEVPTQPNLLMITVEISFAEDGDEADRRYARSQMIRTRPEKL